MTCVTPLCKAVHAFVAPLVHNQKGVIWSVFDPANEDACYLKVWSDRGVRQLRLDGPALDDKMQNVITDWLHEVLQALGK